MSDNLLQLVRLPTYLSTNTLPVAFLPLALLLASTALLSVYVARHLLMRRDAIIFRRLLDGFLLLVALWLIGNATLI